MTINNAVFEPVLKELYPQGSVERALYIDNPLLGMIPKKNNFQGELAKIPIQYARSQNRSANFTDAQSRGAANKYAAWLLTMKRNYGFADIDNLTIESSKTNKGAFVEALSEAMTGAIDGLARNINIDLYRDGNGRVGQRGSDAASVTTLTQEQDITSLEVGQVLVASPNIDGSSLRSGTITITSVDRDAGTFSYTGTITGYADNDYLFFQGDIGSKISGLGEWIPDQAPASTPFYGVDRSIDSTRLGGVRFPEGANYSVREALFRASVRLHREGGMPDYTFMNPDNYAALLSELESDALYDKAQAKTFGNVDYGISYNALVVHGPRGTIKVISDRDCPVGKSYMLTMKTLEMWSIGEPVRVFDLDGTPMLRQPTSDGVEIRCFSYSNLVVKDPGKNAVITLPDLV